MKIIECYKCGDVKECKSYISVNREFPTWCDKGELICDDCKKAIDILEKKEEENIRRFEKKQNYNWIKRRDKILKKSGGL